MGKPLSPKDFFLEIWLIIEDCKYNYTADIRFEKKKLFGCAVMGKTNFEQRPKNVNLVDANLYCHQKKRKVK